MSGVWVEVSDGGVQVPDAGVWAGDTGVEDADVVAVADGGKEVER